MNLWILTEERPKKEVIETIFLKYLNDKNISGFVHNNFAQRVFYIF